MSSNQLYWTNTQNQEVAYPLKRKIIETADGSKTIFLPEWNEHYHSKHGAILEAKHVFIKSGLQYCTKNFSKNISILEVGFGTGLNAFLTALEIKNRPIHINYTGVEAFPVEVEELKLLNYYTSVEEAELFENIHLVAWEKLQKILDNFLLLKQKKMVSEINDSLLYNLIYFDAFGVRVQPELWTETIFKKMYRSLQANGVLVTYAAAGSVRRAMQSAGFMVEKLPGPPGKREMLRAIKKESNIS